jgi:BioD-like phosphotransacetylase family protein
LALQESLNAICHRINAQSSSQEIKTALEVVSRDKDLVIVEGLSIKESAEIIEALDARVLLIHDYSTVLSEVIAEYTKLGTRLLGAVVNKVPQRQLERVRNQYAAQMIEAGINFAGIIPETRTMATLSVSELAEAVKGKILSNPEQSGELIENIMVGSSTFDRGAAYYNRKNNKAVILWGERPGFRKAALSNLQLASLQTSIRCLVISDNGAPIPAVTQKAAEKQIPLIISPGKIPAIIESLEKAMEQLKFNQTKKMPVLADVLRQNLDMEQLSLS